MPLESVREASVDERFQDLLEEKRNHITLKNIKKKKINSKIDNYPYDNQKTIQGEFDYKKESEFGGPLAETKGKFQLRTESGLFLLTKNKDIPRSRKIVESMNEVLESAHIKRDFVPRRDKIWEFVKSAEKIQDIKIVNPDGRIFSYEESDEEEIEDIINEYPINSATLYFKYKSENIRVRYTEDTLNISGNEDLQEYVIQKFEKAVLTD